MNTNFSDNNYCGNCGEIVDYEQNPANAVWPMEYKCDNCGQYANEYGDIYQEGEEQ